MDEIKALLTTEIATLKEGLQHFVKTEDMQKEIASLQKTVEDNNVKGMEAQLAELQKAAEAQGLKLKEIQEQGPRATKSFKESLKEKFADLEKMATDKTHKLVMNTTRKAIVDGSVTANTNAYRDGGVSQIQRGKPWLRDLLNVVTLGSNSHGDVKWYEQLAITNNATAVTEGPGNTAYGTASDLTWVEKSLGGKRLKDFIKVSKDQLKDVDFIAGEIRGLIEKNMRLLENTQLLSGTGLTVHVNGLLTYAPAFVTTNIAVPQANLFDLIQKMKTQMQVNSKDGFLPSNVIINPVDADLIRLAKNTDGSYLFPQWAMGGVPTIGGLNMVENALVAADTLLIGDFAYGTIFEWDGLLIEMGYIGDDFLEGMVTIMAYERINLRVKDNEKGAFMKVASIASDVASITAPVI